MNEKSEALKKKTGVKKWEVKHGVRSGKAGYYAALEHKEREKHKNVGGISYEDSPSGAAIYKRHGVNPKTHKVIVWPKHTNRQGGSKWFDKLK